MSDSLTAVEVFKLFLKKIHTASIPLILLRPRQIDEQTSYEGDYDFFIPSEFNNAMLKIMFETVTKTKTSFYIKRTQYGKLDIVIYNDDSKSIALEIWNILAVKDPMGQTTKYIDNKKLQSAIVQDNTKKYLLSLEFESLYYLSHLFTAGKKINTPLVSERIDYYMKHLKEANSPYWSLFNDLKSRKTDIETVAHDANLKLVSLGFLIYKKSPKSVKDLLHKTKANNIRLQRQVMMFGRFVSIIGPDGVGKTTLINNCINSIMSLKKRTNTKIIFIPEMVKLKCIA